MSKLFRYTGEHIKRNETRQGCKTHKKTFNPTKETWWKRKRHEDYPAFVASSIQQMQGSLGVFSFPPCFSSSVGFLCVLHPALFPFCRFIPASEYFYRKFVTPSSVGNVNNCSSIARVRKCSTSKTQNSRSCFFLHKKFIVQ